MADPTTVDFFQGDYARKAADDGPILLRNRYYEVNPHLSESGVSLLARPGMRYLTTVGEGPIRAMYTKEDAFNGDMFIASGASMYRMDKLLASTAFFNDLFSPERGTVNMTVTSAIGTEVPEFLFYADGRSLFVYMDSGYALGTLTGTAANGDVVLINTVYYTFTNGSVDAGAPAGTMANPWKVALSLSPIISWQNLAAAINASGVDGVTYSTALTDANAAAQAVIAAAAYLIVQSRLPGVVGNAIVTTETGAGIAWGGGTLAGGGAPLNRQVQMPEDVGAFDVATINSFVIVLPTQEGAYKGRAYYIEPGETTIDPLNYITAERSPDGILAVEVVGDLFWLPGSGSTEPWYVSQDPAQRMQPLKGVVFDRGTWQGTAAAIHESLIVCDANGAVFKITGNAPKRMSTPGIEGQIRRAIALQQALTP